MSKEKIGQEERNILSATNILDIAFKTPRIKINRKEFLEDNFARICPPDMVRKIIETSPVAAGVSSNQLKHIAEECIRYEKWKVSGLSAAISIGGETPVTIAAAISADLGQYYAHTFRIVQKLAYIYGWPELIQGRKFDDECKNKLLAFLGVMMGVDGAKDLLMQMGKTFGEKLAKKIGQTAVTKTSWYPLLKKVVEAIGGKLTKKALQEFPKKAVPVVAVVASGVLTYYFFDKEANKLRRFLAENPFKY